MSLVYGVSGSDSVAVVGTATAPTASQTIAITAALPEGLYRVSCAGRIEGATAADRNNIALSVAGGATLGRALVGIGSVEASVFESFVQLSGAQVLVAFAVGAASGSAVYSASITATRLNS